MIQAKYIRRMYFEEVKNISEIARETGHDRKTIKAYLEKEDWNVNPPRAKKVSDYPKLEPYKKGINKWLNEDKKSKLTLFALSKSARCNDI